MNKLVFYIFIILIINSCTEAISPSLKPSTVEKTIKRFNYCLNKIDKPHIFETIDQILIGKAEEELDELNDIISLSKRKQTSYRDKLLQYRAYAKALKIKITDIQINGNEAKVLAIFFDTTFLIEELKVIHLKKLREIWRIESIIPDNKKDIKNND